MKFNAEKQVERVVEFIGNYYKNNNLSGVVIVTS